MPSQCRFRKWDPGIKEGQSRALSVSVTRSTLTLRSIEAQSSDSEEESSRCLMGVAADM
jgi:hypothetical protein